ncbi:MAG: beta/gamma crystallin-related protein [Erythrobacter sp.]
MFTRLLAILAGGALALSIIAAAHAQPGDLALRPEPKPEAIIYRDAVFQGPAVNISEPQPRLRLWFQVNSVRIKGGEWQLCDNTDYQGNCRVLVRDT